MKKRQTKTRDFSRVLAMGDTHCGSVTGLTPPSFELEPERGTSAFTLYELRRWLYAHWAQTIDDFGPFDLALFNGDLIDGDQSRSSGWELLEGDRLAQAEMVKAVVHRVGAPVNKFVMGTAYHTGPDEDFEALVANEFDEEVLKEQVVRIDGVTIHATHHVSGSALSHTRQNALGREITDMLVRLAKGRIDAKDVHLLLRSHCHYGGSVSDHGVQAHRVPALQLANGHKWARRFPSATLDYGVLVVDVYGPGVFSVHPVTWELPPERAVEVDSGLIDRASAETRRLTYDVLMSTPSTTPLVPSGYVGGR